MLAYLDAGLLNKLPYNVLVVEFNSKNVRK